METHDWALDLLPLALPPDLPPVILIEFLGLNGLVLDGLLSEIELVDRVALWMSWMEVDEEGGDSGGRAVYKVAGSLCCGSEINSLVSADRGASFCAHVAKRITGGRINNS